MIHFLSKNKIGRFKVNISMHAYSAYYLVPVPSIIPVANGTV